MEMLFGRNHDMLLPVLGIIFTSSLFGAILGAVIASLITRSRLCSDKVVTVFLSTLPALPVSYQCTEVMSSAVGQGALANPGILMLTTVACFPVALILSVVLSCFWRAEAKPDDND